MRRFSFLLILLALAGCAGKEELSVPMGVALTPVSFEDVDGWDADDFAAALPALQKSCAVAGAPWRAFCQGLDNVKADQVRAYMEKNLVPYRVTDNGSDKGVFTGYYEASLTGARQQTDTCQTPIYGVPSDMVRVDLAAFGVKSDKTQIVGRLDAGQLVPYYTRAEAGKMDAPVLLWVDSPVDAFILHIQGSGRVQTPDGVIHVGYAANNGHTFKGIGAIMADKGVLQAGKSSMPYIRDWLKDNPKQAAELMAKNPRYIFFKELPQAQAPIGAAGVELTPMRSIAVDTRYVPLHTPVFLNTQTPEGKKLQHLVVAQDIGAAIQGAVRADFFWGYGEEAFHNAGRMKSVGSYHILWPKGQKLPAIK